MAGGGAPSRSPATAHRRPGAQPSSAGSARSPRIPTPGSIVAILSARMLMIGVCDVLFVLIAIEQFGTGESGAAILSAAIGAGGILGGTAGFLLVGRRRLAPVLLGCGIAWGVMFALFGVVASGTVAPALLVAAGGRLALMDVAGRTALQRAVQRRGAGPRVRDPRGADDRLPRGRAPSCCRSRWPLFGIPARGARLRDVHPARRPARLARAPSDRPQVGRAGPGARAPARLPPVRGARPAAIESLARSATWRTVPQGVDGRSARATSATGSTSSSRAPSRSAGAARRSGSWRHRATRSARSRCCGTSRGRPRSPRRPRPSSSSLGRAEFLAAVTGHPVVHAEAGRVVDEHLLADRRPPPA